MAAGFQDLLVLQGLWFNQGAEYEAKVTQTFKASKRTAFQTVKRAVFKAPKRTAFKAREQ